VSISLCNPSPSLTYVVQYAQPVTKKGAKAAAGAAEEKKEGEEKKLSNHAQRNLAERKKGMRRFNFSPFGDRGLVDGMPVTRRQD
jgi:hypothetical protein